MGKISEDAKGWGRKDLSNCTTLGPTVTEQGILHLVSLIDQYALALQGNTWEAQGGGYGNR